MYGKLCSCVSFVRSNFVALAVVGMLALSSGSLFAAEPTSEIALVPSGIAWTNFPTKLVEVLLPPVIAGISICFSVWALIQGVKFIRGTASGK